MNEMTPEQRKELETLAKMVRNSVHPIKESTILPISNDKLIRWLRGLQHIPTSLKFLAPDPETVKEGIQQMEKNPNVHETGIIDKLCDELDKYQRDVDFVYNPVYSKSLKANNLIENRITTYFSKRIYRYVKLISDYIEGLIQYDSFPESLFGNYHVLLEDFKNASDDEERQDKLDKLVIIANSIIPAHIKSQTVNVIEPAISKSANPRDA